MPHGTSPKGHTTVSSLLATLRNLQRSGEGESETYLVNIASSSESLSLLIAKLLDDGKLLVEANISLPASAGQLPDDELISLLSTILYDQEKMPTLN
jgi:hypothetical protein